MKYNLKKYRRKIRNNRLTYDLKRTNMLSHSGLSHTGRLYGLMNSLIRRPALSVTRNIFHAFLLQSMRLLSVLSTAKCIMIVVLPAFSFLLLVSCATDDDRLTIGLISPSTDWLPVALSLEKGLLDETEVKLHYFSSGWEVNEALLAGRLDLAIMPFTYAWKGVSEGKEVRIISFFERESDGIIASSGIESLDDLSNHKLGVLRASTLDIFVNMIMEKYGFEPEIVYFRTPTEMAASLQEGYVDALSFYVPQIFMIDESFERIYWFRDTYPSHPCCDIVASKHAVNNKKEEIGQFLEIMRISCAVIKDDPQLAKEVMAKRWRLDPYLAGTVLEYTGFELSLDASGQKFQLEAAKMMKNLGYIKRMPDPAEVYYYEFIQN